jgi:two-component system alkaline phosphatase synthesis response regulator PhoP
MLPLSVDARANLMYATIEARVIVKHTMRTILIVDDEPEIIRVARAYLEQAGYRVLAAANGQSAIALFEREHPDLVILDLNLPTPPAGPPMDGLDVARTIRQQPGLPGNTPIIMLTARVDEMDRVIGLELGADDYVPKPFSPRELVARVRAVLRRLAPPSAEGTVIDAGRLTINPARHQVTLDGEPVELTPTEFTLLTTMAAAPGQVFSRARLLDALGLDYEGLERTVDSHIKNLRAKIERNSQQPEFILTVFGIGYKFAELDTDG